MGSSKTLDAGVDTRLEEGEVGRLEEADVGTLDTDELEEEDGSPSSGRYGLVFIGVMQTQTRMDEGVYVTVPVRRLLYLGRNHNIRN